MGKPDIQLPALGAGGEGETSMNDSETRKDILISDLAGEPDPADLVELFVNNLPIRVQAIRRACSEADLATLIMLAHQLKGSAGGYGFPAITEAAANLEASIKEHTSFDNLVEAAQ